MRKYQWDDIHNLRKVKLWGQNEEENASVNKREAYKQIERLRYGRATRNPISLTDYSFMFEEFEYPKGSSDPIMFYGIHATEGEYLMTDNYSVGNTVMRQSQCLKFVFTHSGENCDNPDYLSNIQFTSYPEELTLVVNSKQNNKFVTEILTLEYSTWLSEFKQLIKEMNWERLQYYPEEAYSELSVKDRIEVIEGIFAGGIISDGYLGVPDFWLELPSVDYDMFTNNTVAYFNYYKKGGLLCRLSSNHYYYSNVDQSGETFYMLWNEPGKRWDFWSPPEPDCLSCDLRKLISYQAIWMLFKESGHESLDAIGMVPAIGEIADAINAAWYLIEGDKINASLSATSMIPVIGDIAGKSVKYVVKVGKEIKIVELQTNSLQLFVNLGKKLDANIPKKLADNYLVCLAQLTQKVGDNKATLEYLRDNFTPKVIC